MRTIQDWAADTEPIDEQLGEPSALRFPDGWDTSTSWKRAQRENCECSPINDAEWMVSMETSEDYHRVVFVLDGPRLLAECSCLGHRYRGWCAHVAKLAWLWSCGEILVTHRQTGRGYRLPPRWMQFGDQARTRSEDLDGLTAAELDAYLTCELSHVGVREFARTTDRAPGTVGNLLARAREKVDQGVAYTDGGQR